MRWLLPLMLAACAGPLKKAEDTSSDGNTPTVVDTGTRIAAQIEVDPASLDFGAVPPGCAVLQSLEVRNSGNYPLELREYELSEDPWGVFEVGAESTVLGPDATTTVSVRFAPKAPQLYEGAFLRILSDDSDDFKLDVPLRGEGQADEPTSDTFVQASGRSVDLLFVLDDDSNLSGRLTALAEESALLLDSLDRFGVDYHVAVIDLEAEHGGAFLGPVVRSDTPDGAAVLGDAIRAAIGGGAGSPAFFDVSQAALTEPLLSGANAGFLRDGSYLSLVAYSERDDGSGQTGAVFADWFDSLRDPALTGFSGVTGPLRGLLPCSPFGDSIEPAPRLGTAITNTDGLHMEICDYGAPGIMEDLSVFTAGLEDSFALSLPVTQDDWMYVLVDGEEVPRDGNDGWTYVAGPNEVRFHGEGVPLAGQTIEVNYPAAVPCP
ncbi:MAG: hypothetical protein ACI8PZ_003615 [Myxococcota bacterium]|jgi:hypothetical protein